MRYRTLARIAVAALMLGGALAGPAIAGAAWFKGNTHAHTRNSDGADTPSEVARWYQAHGYDFLVLSDHNRVTSPASATIDPNGRSLLVMRGCEVTSRDASTNSPVHTTAIGAGRPPMWVHSFTGIPRVVRFEAESAARAGGLPILNHPLQYAGFSAEDLSAPDSPRIIEVWNGHVFSRGNYLGGSLANMSAENLWDELLTRGRRVWGLAADDLHTLNPPAPHYPRPGTVWVFVRAKSLTPTSITAAIERGEFYMSTGVVLSDWRSGKDRVSIRINESATANELADGELSAAHFGSGRTGWLVEFVGPGGVTLASSTATSAAFKLPRGLAYVRARVTYTAAAPDGGFNRYYAWTQPAFGATSSRQRPR